MHQSIIRTASTFNQPTPVEYDPSTHRLVYIHLTSLSLSPSYVSCDDWQAFGLWGVVVPRSIPSTLAANAALDVFHWQVSIKDLDAVDWSVWDAITGHDLERDEEVDWYTFDEEAAQVHFVGHLG